jgi:hypothetical protein
VACCLLTLVSTRVGNDKERQVSKPYNDNLRKLLQMTRDMLALSDEGDRDRNDDACGIIFGILRDTGYRLRKLAEEECEKHREKGKWD